VQGSAAFSGDAVTN